MDEIENTDVITETQVQESTDNTKDRAVASLLASVGIREDGTRFNPNEQSETEEVPEVQEKPIEKEKKTTEEKHERRATQKLARRLKKQQEAYEKDKAEFEKKISIAKEDPIAYLQEMGITLSDWAEKQLDTKENKAFKEIEKLRKEMQDKEQKAAEERIKQESEYYHKELTGIVYNEFKNSANKFTHINALVSEGLFNNEFFEAIAAKAQYEYDTTGEQPDLESIFMEEEKELEKLTNALLKIHNQRPVVGRVGNNSPKTTTPVANTLSNRVNQVTSANKEPETPEEIKAKVMEKYGIGKAYNP